MERASDGLWVIRADGIEEYWLGAGSGPVWSHDGRWLAFSDGSAVWLAEAGMWRLWQLDLPVGAAVVDWVPIATHSTVDVSPEVTLSLVRYSDPGLGFAVDYPWGWQVSDRTYTVDPLERSWSGIEFRSNLYGYGEQVFGKYVASVAVGESVGKTLTETVEYGLSSIEPPLRDAIQIQCCLDVGGEPALELSFGWPMARWGSRQIVTLHEGREYRLNFSPQRTLDGNTPSDAAARAAFDAFLHTFTFIPVTITPLLPTPTITPAPTPPPQ
jgi:hypothetical protein